jgi:hypothetical protein
VLLDGIHRALFAGAATAGLGDRTRLLLGLGGFLDLFLAGFAVSALQVVHRLFGIETFLFGGFGGGNALSFGLGFRFLAGALPLKALSLPLGADGFRPLVALSLMAWV